MELSQAAIDGLGLASDEQELLLALFTGADTSGHYEDTWDALKSKRLIAVSANGEVSLAGAKARLRASTERAPDGQPVRRIGYRSLREQIAAIAAAAKTPAAGVAAAYEFVFGRQIQRHQWGLCGKLGAAMPPQRAALIFLEHASDNFDGDPLQELSGLILWEAARRSGGAQTPEEERAEKDRHFELHKQAQAGRADRLKMYRERWGASTLAETVSAIRALEVSQAQKEAMVRQAGLDFLD